MQTLQKLTTTECCLFRIVNDPNRDLTGWDKPKIFEELIKPPQNPTRTEALPYVFDHDDSDTESILFHVNSISLGDSMQLRVLKLLHPDCSCLCHKYDAFTIQYVSKTKSKIAILTVKANKHSSVKYTPSSLIHAANTLT